MEEDVKKTAGKEETVVASEDITFVGTQLDLVCLGDEIVYGSSVPHSSDGNGSTGENNNKLGLASGEVRAVFFLSHKIEILGIAKIVQQVPSLSVALAVSIPYPAFYILYPLCSDEADFTNLLPCSLKWAPFSFCAGAWWLRGRPHCPRYPDHQE